MSLTPTDAAGPIQRGEPLREAVYQRIVALISSGEYPAGAALTEASLSRSLEVSRTPIREALLRLEAEGVLESALARGFTVRRLHRWEAEELYPILSSLEALAIGTTAQLNAEVLDDLQATAEELAQCQEPVQRWKLDSRWHTLLVSLSGNSKLIEMIRSLRTSLSRYELAYMQEVTVRTEADNQHTAILEALRSDDREQAASLVESHWTDGMTLVLKWLGD